MYLNAQTLALANQAVIEAFENCSVTWRVIPRWDTGDPAQTQVPADDVTAASPGLLAIDGWRIPFDVTLATAIAPTPTALLNLVTAKTVELAAAVDKTVVLALRAKSTPVNFDETTPPDTILASLLSARAQVEQNGFRAPSAALTTTDGLTTLSQMVSGYSVLNSLLDAANINSLHRVNELEDPLPATDIARVLLLGRHQRIPDGGAADASPGEEPVDFAVSVAPSLEVIGESGDNRIALAVRARGAVRVKDPGALVVLN
jgi:hypothetical protein